MLMNLHRITSIFVVTVSLIAWSGCGKPAADDPANRGSDAQQGAADSSPPKTAREVLNRMVAAYKAAKSYGDFGEGRLQVSRGGESIDQKTRLSVQMTRPDKLSFQLNQAVVTTDGSQWCAWIRNLPGQAVVRPAPTKLSIRAVLADPVLAQAVQRGFDDSVPQISLMSPQLVLLLDDQPLEKMLSGMKGEPELDESGRIGDDECYRVRVTWEVGAGVWWIDKKTFVLRRMIYPSGGLDQFFGGREQVQSLSLVADFAGAKFDAPIDPKAFQFEAGQGVAQLKMFSVPEIYQLQGEPVPNFDLTDLQGKSVTPKTLAGKPAVLVFWSATSDPGLRALDEVEKARQKLKDKDAVAVFAVNIDPKEIDDKTVAETAKQVKFDFPIVRDPKREFIPALRVDGMMPAVYLLDAKGVVQTCGIYDPSELAGSLAAQLEKLAAGEDMSKQAVANYRQQLDAYARYVDEVFAGKVSDAATPPAETKAAPKSQPATLTLKQLWKAEEVKSPGNILVVQKSGAAPRIFVLDEWRTIREIGADGKVLATHKPELAEKEVLVMLRAAMAGDKTTYAAFMLSGQRALFFDEQWKQLLAYPENTKSPHTGIIDVQMGDLEGDGKLKAYIGYNGAAGIQAVGLDGQRLWSNRSLASVLRTAFTPPDEKGRRQLLCASESGNIMVLDAKGERVREISVPNWNLGYIVGADLKGDGQTCWCALALDGKGQGFAMGISLTGEVLWTYELPKGMPTQPVEPVVAGRLKTSGPGAWILPGCDGSIHFVGADGKPIDRYNYGAGVGGLATVELDGRAVLLISSENGLQAYEVR